ncbi:hypothetical protein V7149_05460 [Bacillus sp. JJ1503]|uniref:hypothetical protein n=1 Tax=Bacillus sp. JJ1503 TaxID=3122956 RepID=UPI002FFD7722
MAGVLIAHYYVVERGGRKIEAKGLAGITSLITIGLLTQFNLMPFAAITSIIASIILYLVVYYGVEKPLFGENLIEDEADKEAVS